MERERLVIADDGTGFDMRRPTSGRGLNNLRWRAEKLGAKIAISSGASGTEVCLFWEDMPGGGAAGD